jgi:TM2 domain-containing membrane protein YozV
MRRRSIRRGFGNRVGSNRRRKTRSNQKSLIVCIFLWLFLGFLGMHRFYVGKNFSAFFMFLSIFTIIGFVVWWISDGFKIITGNFKDKRGRKISWGFRVVFDR